MQQIIILLGYTYIVSLKKITRNARRRNPAIHATRSKRCDVETKQTMEIICRQLLVLLH